MRLINTCIALCLLLFPLAASSQTTLFSEDFETGGASFTLNTADLGGTSNPNYWIVNNAYTGGSGSLMCFGFPFTFTIQNTPTQSFHPNPTSYYLHTMSVYGQASNIYCSSFAASDGFCIFNSTNFCKQAAGINTTGYSGVTLQFYWNCAGGTAIYGELYYSTNGGTSWTQVTTPISQYINQATWTQQTVSLPAFDNVADLRFAFRFVNNQSSSALDPGFSIDDITVVGTPMGANTLSTGSLSSNQLCAGDTLVLPYSLTGTYNPGNTFTAQLSNAAGSFAAPTSVGSVVSTTAGTITVVIPPATPAGSGYRLRVVASNPSTTGSDNGSNITIGALPVAGTASASGPLTICQGGSVSLNLAGSNGSLAWESSPNGTNWTGTGQTGNPATFVLSTLTHFRAAVSNGCGTVYSNPVTVNVSPTNANYATGMLSRDSICDGDTTTVQMLYYGSAITWYTSTNGGTTWNLSANTHPTTYHTPPLSAANVNWVRAIVDNGPCGYDTIDVPIHVEAVAAAFTYLQNMATYTFTDGSTNAVAWAWDFGDGNTSALPNPVHTYASGGTYTVTLTVTSPLGCTSTHTQTVTAPVGRHEPALAGLGVSPNPFRDAIGLSAHWGEAGQLRLELMDMQGRPVARKAVDVAAGRWEMDWSEGLGELAAGSYLLRASLGDATKTVVLMKVD